MPGECTTDLTSRNRGENGRGALPPVSVGVFFVVNILNSTQACHADISIVGSTR